MASASYPLVAKFASVVLDGTGSGTVQLGPQRVREHWQPDGVAVSVTTNAAEAQASCYVGTQPSASQLVGQTATASSGDTCSMGGMDVQTGQLIIVKWTGGDPGATATAVVTGTYTVGAPT